jgi:geranylgeranylglycerol-phosphate geranylgeranyltransferase
MSVDTRFIPGAVQISRPVNVLIALISIVIGAAITGTIQPLWKVILAALSGGLIMAGANTINDVFDVEIDRINRPKRPLIAGKLSIHQARILAWWEFGIGVALSLFISFPAFWVALIISSLIVLYSYKLKRMPLIGNFAVSLSTSMAFVYGGLAVNRFQQTLVPTILAFFYHFGREIIKDIEDMKGDRQENARTFPLVYGEIPALAVTTFIFVLLVILLPVPFMLKWYQMAYLGTVLLGVYPVLLYVVISMWRDRSSRNLGFLSNLLKADMLVGLLAIFLG